MKRIGSVTVIIATLFVLALSGMGAFHLYSSASFSSERKEAQSTSSASAALRSERNTLKTLLDETN